MPEQLPPDGSSFVEVVEDVLDLQRYVSLVADDSAGAIATFLGVTRNNFKGKAVVKLEYEAYTPMALKKLKVSPNVAEAQDCVGVADVL